MLDKLHGIKLVFHGNRRLAESSSSTQKSAIGILYRGEKWHFDATNIRQNGTIANDLLARNGKVEEVQTIGRTNERAKNNHRKIYCRASFSIARTAAERVFLCECVQASERASVSFHWNIIIYDFMTCRAVAKVTVRCKPHIVPLFQNAEKEHWTNKKTQRRDRRRRLTNNNTHFLWCLRPNVVVSAGNSFEEWLSLFSLIFGWFLVDATFGNDWGMCSFHATVLTQSDDEFRKGFKKSRESPKKIPEDIQHHEHKRIWEKWEYEYEFSSYSTTRSDAHSSKWKKNELNCVRTRSTSVVSAWKQAKLQLQRRYKSLSDSADVCCAHCATTDTNLHGSGFVLLDSTIHSMGSLHAQFIFMLRFGFLWLCTQ